MGTIEGKTKYFAAANTGKGFKSFFEEIFFSPRIVRAYIIKGGPGTGKSSFMKRVALAAETRGRYVEYYYCSSDTHSLDGVVIDGTIAVFDGTAPHSYDTVRPGVRDKIIDLGEFWDADALSKAGKEIDELCDIKKRAYANAYGYLRAAYETNGVMRSLSSCFVCWDKMRAAARRMYSRLSLPRGASEIGTRQTRAMGVFGRERFDTLEKMAEKKYFVTEYYGVDTAFLSEILSIASENGVRCLVSYDTLDPSVPVELYFPDAGAWFGTYEGENDGECINMKRFVDARVLAEVRGEYRTAERVMETLCSLAVSELGVAGDAHAKLEKFYVSSMDFKRQSELCTSFIEKMG